MCPAHWITVHIPTGRTNRVFVPSHGFPCYTASDTIRSPVLGTWHMNDRFISSYSMLQPLSKAVVAVVVDVAKVGKKFWECNEKYEKESELVAYIHLGPGCCPDQVADDSKQNHPKYFLQLQTLVPLGATALLQEKLHNKLIQSGPHNTAKPCAQRYLQSTKWPAIKMDTKVNHSVRNNTSGIITVYSIKASMC
jgi:hypothetical protein